jgi:hypothetical protein
VPHSVISGSKPPFRFGDLACMRRLISLSATRSQLSSKAKKNISSRDAKGIRKLQEEDILSVFLLVSDDPVCRIEHGITFIHWPLFLKQLWQNVFGFAPINEDYRPHIS